STTARPCPSSPATARSGRAGSTRCRSARSRSTAPTSASSPRARRVLASIAEQGKLTPELRRRIEACATKAELEDLYLPYKKKRRTRATIARERGPLADRILAQPPSGDPRAEAARFTDPKSGLPDAESALAGARDIVAPCPGACRRRRARSHRRAGSST